MMNRFFKKYFIIIFLSFLVIVLLFLKIFSNNSQTEVIKIIPTPTIIYPDPSKVTLEELKQMDNQTLTNYLQGLTKEQRDKLPEEVPTE